MTPRMREEPTRSLLLLDANPEEGRAWIKRAANPGQGDPTKLVLSGVRPVTVQVPFTVQNVPLPGQQGR